MARRISSVLVDLSGTLHVDDIAIPGSVEALNRLRKSGLKVKFVTNTTKESKRCLFERLRKLSFDVKKDEIFTSLTAARTRIEQNSLRPMLLLEDSAMEDFEGISRTDPNAVVIGLAPSQFNYAQMNRAFQLLLRGAPLIAIHKARYYKTTEGLALGPGPFVSGLEFSAGVTADVIGKPESAFFRSALEEMGSAPQEAVMIGDDVHGDIEGAQKTGLCGILVKTGKYRENDELKIDPPPYQTCDDFSKAVDFILCETNQQKKT